LSQFKTHNQLNKEQLEQYNQAIADAFPPILAESPIILAYWQRLENNYPQHQHYLMSTDGELIGFMNTVPFRFEKQLEELPQEGWDWMLAKGLKDFENNHEASYLGGLQVIVRKKYQKQGFSKKIINHCREHLSDKLKLVIPIRPIKKHEFPSMPMDDYLKLKDHDNIFDPWIRVHMSGGAQIIKVCEKSMTIEGDLKFWEKMFGRKIETSGEHILSGALSPILIDMENNSGVYMEPNIWIKY